MQKLGIKVMSLLNDLVHKEAITAERSKAIALAYMVTGDLDRVISDIYSSGFNVFRMDDIQETVTKLSNLKQQ